RPGGRGLRGDDRRRERASRGSGREPDEGEEADEHALVNRGRAGAADPAEAAVVGAGAGVHQQRRVRGGNAGTRAAAEGRAVGSEAANGSVAQSARARGGGYAIVSL